MSNYLIKKLNNCLRYGLVFIPQTCLLCGAKSHNEKLCRDCSNELPRLLGPRCPRCALPTDGNLCGTCLRKLPAFSGVIAALIYTFPVDAIIKSLKYHRNLAVTEVLAETLLKAIPQENEPDLLVPVPLSREKQCERGFNQAHEISKVLTRRLGIPIIAEACSRIRNTPSQTTLPWNQREKNIRGAFACSSDFSGKRIAVVDDVMTTGATLHELANTLRKHGANDVVAWVVARTLPS